MARVLAPRPPSCAGSVYPSQPAALRRALDAWLGLEGRAQGRARPPTRLLVAPHIDYPRGARGWAAAYGALAGDADLFVVLATAHATPPRLFALTRRDHATPLGLVPTDRAALASLVAELGEAEVLADEAAHDGEHSVELQLVALRHVVRRPFTVLPVLCSAISHLEDPVPSTARFLAALGRAVAGRRVTFVASADLAHVGPGYGDVRPPTAAEAARLEARDRETLAFVAAGDAAGFHRDAWRDDARRRLCGLAPIYAALRASGVGAALLHYERWTDGVDSVSFAAAAG
jgi:MEMO1 family protein